MLATYDVDVKKRKPYKQNSIKTCQKKKKTAKRVDC